MATSTFNNTQNVAGNTNNDVYVHDFSRSNMPNGRFAPTTMRFVNAIKKNTTEAKKYRSLQALQTYFSPKVLTKVYAASF